MMSKQNFQIERCQILMMKKIDGEITPAEERELQALLAENPHARRELAQFQQLKTESAAMKKYVLPEIAWEDYWNKIYNRLERGISWILIFVGAIVVLGYAVVEMVNAFLKDTGMPVLLKFGILALLLGGVVLLVSVIREKLILRKHDKYKEIQR